MSKRCSSVISKNFEKFLKAMESKNKNDCHSNITFQIYYDLFKIREAQWNYKQRVNRKVDYSLADIFQDIIAHYLRIFLSNKFTVHLEYKKGKLRPDILIKKENKNWAIIEIKTTIGWNRDLIKNENYLIRLKELKEEFKVPLKRIFYIFESSRNVNNDFSKEFRKKNKSKITRYILPLFEESAGRYYFLDKEENNPVRKYTAKKIFELYNKKETITEFKDILERITAK